MRATATNTVRNTTIVDANDVTAAIRSRRDESEDIEFEEDEDRIASTLLALLFNGVFCSALA